MLGMQLAIPFMEKYESGLIVNISSISDLTGMNGAGTYTTSKGAVRSITKAADVDYGMKISVLTPYTRLYSDTDVCSTHGTSRFQELFLVSNCPTKPGNAEEVATAVLLLTSDEASHITGIELPISLVKILSVIFDYSVLSYAWHLQ